MSQVCARCPKVLGNSCCEVKPSEQLATLTWADVDRLQEATGLRLEAITEFEWLDEGAAAGWLQVHPSWAGYFAAATRRLTLKRRGSACVFHTATGCSLTAQQRPTACRLYPFEVRAGSQWGLQVDRFGSVEDAVASNEHACLAVEEAASFEALWEAFGTTREALEELQLRLRQEVKAHRQREQGLP